MTTVICVALLNRSSFHVYTFSISKQRYKGLSYIFTHVFTLISLHA